MLVAALAKTGVTGPVVSGNRGTCGNGTLDEAAERGGAAIGHDGKPNAPGVTTALTLVELCAGFALANLDGAGDQHLVRDAPAFSSRPTTDIAFIDFDVLAKPAANPILIWSNHTGTQLVQDLESGFVTRKPDLALELHGRHAGRLAGDQIGGPEPHAQRCMGTLHDRSGREANVAATVTAAQNPRPAGKMERFSSRLAIGADKPTPPPHLLQICGARSIIREQPLELGQRPRKRQVTPLQNVHARHHPPSCPSLHILQVVGMGDNRIGKERTIESIFKPFRTIWSKSVISRRPRSSFQIHLCSPKRRDETQCVRLR